MAEPAAVLALPRRRSPAAAALVAMRPRQWTKNLLLFAGIIFAAKLGDPTRWVAAVTGFVAYCAASSAASNSASVICAVRPSVSAREKLAITPGLRARITFESSRE